MHLKTSTLRRAHRVMGLVVGLQLLLWAASGAFFVWSDLDEVHGDHLRNPESGFVLQPGWVSPGSINVSEVSGFVPTQLETLDLVRIAGKTCYRLIDQAGAIVLADVTTGAVRGPLGEDEALALARESFGPDVQLRAASRIDEADVGAHHEYRGGMLPAWVFEFEHASNTRIYVSEAGGQVTRHRNSVWRIFDFLWMVHTMDYVGRDDFNNPVVRVVAVLAIILALSGYWLFGRTSPLLMRRRR
ncbi:hypothetical protein DRQ53_05775 [bacterium]|nr:MAG: hypothetical protein DRQ32_00780 [bacterium]RKZ16628.1 MAG: hypothetical protein DRQ53_05775 [bacterium]